MRLLLTLFLVLMPTGSYSQDRVILQGTTQDCFAGKLIHPASVDIYLLDPQSAPEIAQVLENMKKEMPHGDAPGSDRFFASYERLKSAIRKASVLDHALSSAAGRFAFRDLKANSQVILLGLAEREDEPAYYAYKAFEIKPGLNRATLDFDKGSTCEAGQNVAPVRSRDTEVPH
jgi:hypothetical protein